VLTGGLRAELIARASARDTFGRVRAERGTGVEDCNAIQDREIVARCSGVVAIRSNPDDFKLLQMRTMRFPPGHPVNSRRRSALVKANWRGCEDAIACLGGAEWRALVGSGNPSAQGRVPAIGRGTMTARSPLWLGAPRKVVPNGMPDTRERPGISPAVVDQDVGQTRFLYPVNVESD
jgi:hypothetical protein